MIIIYVANLIIPGESKKVDNFYNEFRKFYVSPNSEPLKIRSPPVTFLGLQYTRGKDYIKIDPSEYTKKILEAFDHANARPLKTTGEPGDFILDMKHRKSRTLPKYGKEHKRYRRLVGQTSWL